MALAREWEALVARARELRGFEDFLRPPRFDTVASAAADGPVVLVNVSRHRCDAVVVEASGPTTVPLPNLSAPAVAERTAGHLAALGRLEEANATLHTAKVAAAGGSRAGALAVEQAVAAYLDAERGVEESLRDVLGWLWEAVAEPVLTALGISGATATPRRLWWCPTGLLGLLPLHAAGHHDGSGRSVLDRVVSSYTPTLRALRAARAREVVPGRRLLVVAEAAPEGQVPLEHVARERDAVRANFDDVTVLDPATVGGVLEHLARHGWAHFACHGDQDLMAPSNGGVLLADGILSVRAVAEAEYRGEFAFLSACKSATGGIVLPDEVVTLTAALHHAGFRHVIGTLWSVGDQAAADVAEAVYRRLRGSPDASRSAHALHDCLVGLRDAEAPLVAWTPFTHTGP